MKTSIMCFVILAAIFLVRCQDGSMESNLISEIEYYNNYPFKILAKTTDEIESLQSEFDALNENNICTNLDQFGFTDDIRPCYKNNIKQNITDQNIILAMVKAELVKNSKFTNVFDSTNLKVQRIDQHDTSPIELQIRFENQVIDGIYVKDTNIRVNFYGDYICNIIGSWVPEVPVPPKEFGLSISEAKGKILGEKLEYSCLTSGEITITSSSILDEFTEKCICPIKSDKYIELNIVYRFTIGMGESQDPSFHIYVDIFTGEIIEIRQLFRC